MSGDKFSCLHLIERAYSYLQRAGLSELECCRHVQWLAGELADRLAHGEPSPEQLDTLWQHLMDEAAQRAVAEAAMPVLAPAPLRGSIGYARFG